MKILLIAAVFAMCLGLKKSAASAEEDQGDSSVFWRGYLKSDQTQEAIYDRSGQMVGGLRQDPLLKNRTNIYDQQGRRKGYLEKDLLLEGQTYIYNRSGEQ